MGDYESNRIYPPPLSSDPINQANGVSPQNQVGNAGNKTVQKNHPPETGNTITGNNTQTTMTGTLKKLRSISRPSGNVMSGKHTGFNHIKGFFQAFKDTVSAKIQNHKAKKQENSGSVDAHEDSRVKDFTKMFAGFDLGEEKSKLLAELVCSMNDGGFDVSAFIKNTVTHFKNYDDAEIKTMIGLARENPELNLDELSELGKIKDLGVSVDREALNQIPKEYRHECLSLVSRSKDKDTANTLLDRCMFLFNSANKLNDEQKKMGFDKFRSNVENGFFPSEKNLICQIYLSEEEVFSRIMFRSCTDDQISGLYNAFLDDPEKGFQEAEELAKPELRSMISGSRHIKEEDIKDFSFEELAFLHTNRWPADNNTRVKNFVKFTNLAKNDYKDSPEKLNKMLNLLKEEVKNNSSNLMYENRYSVLKNKIDGNPQSTTIQAPKAQTQSLTEEQIKLRNECNALVYSSWRDRSTGITRALTEKCPSEEKLQEFKEFFLKYWNDASLVKHKVYEITGISIR